jgi:hypothetical protein
MVADARLRVLLPAQTTNVATSSTSTTPTTLPFAPTTVDAGSAATVTAPAPGASGTAYGPNDSYTAGASRLVVGGVATLAVAMAVGGLAVML